MNNVGHHGGESAATFGEARDHSMFGLRSMKKREERSNPRPVVAPNTTPRVGLSKSMAVSKLSAVPPGRFYDNSKPHTNTPSRMAPNPDSINRKIRPGGAKANAISVEDDENSDEVQDFDAAPRATIKKRNDMANPHRYGRHTNGNGCRSSLPMGKSPSRSSALLKKTFEKSPGASRVVPFDSDDDEDLPSLGSRTLAKSSQDRSKKASVKTLAPASSPLTLDDSEDPLSIGNNDQSARRVEPVKKAKRKSLVRRATPTKVVVHQDELEPSSPETISSSQPKSSQAKPSQPKSSQTKRAHRKNQPDSPVRVDSMSSYRSSPRFSSPAGVVSSPLKRSSPDTNSSDELYRQSPKRPRSHIPGNTARKGKGRASQPLSPLPTTRIKPKKKKLVMSDPDETDEPEKEATPPRRNDSRKPMPKKRKPGAQDRSDAVIDPFPMNLNGDMTRRPVPKRGTRTTKSEEKSNGPEIQSFPVQLDDRKVRAQKDETRQEYLRVKGLLNDDARGILEKSTGNGMSIQMLEDFENAEEQSDDMMEGGLYDDEQLSARMASLS